MINKDSLYDDLYGMIALCSLGKPGLITSHGPVPVEYPDGNTGLAHTGVQLTDADEATHREYAARFGSSDNSHPANFIGGPWASRTPKVIGSMADLLEEQLGWE